jgi:hypothetical protein
MQKASYLKKGLYLSGCTLLALFATACSPASTVAPQAAPTITALPPTSPVLMSPSSATTISAVQKTPAVMPSATTKPSQPCATIAVDYIQHSLAERIGQSEQIFLGEIVNIGDFIWNTSDGKAPPDPCATKYGQLALVQVLVRESFKGDLKPDATINLLISDAPGALLGNTTPRFAIPVKKAEPIIWFLGKEVNYRPENSQNSLNYPALLEGFSKNQAGTWVGGIASPRFTDINQLKVLINNPLLTPTPSK